MTFSIKSEDLTFKNLRSQFRTFFYLSTFESKNEILLENIDMYYT